MSTNIVCGKSLMSAKKIVWDLREECEKSWVNTKETVIEIEDDSTEIMNGSDLGENVEQFMDMDINSAIDEWLNSM